MRKYLIYILGVTLLTSCTNHPYMGPQISRSMQISKDRGLFMWEYEPDKDSLTVYGQKILLPIKESFAEPAYKYFGGHTYVVVPHKASFLSHAYAQGEIAGHKDCLLSLI